MVAPSKLPIHPLSSLRAEEIATASKIVKDANSGKNLTFKVVALEEPPKDKVVPYLEAENAGKPLPATPNRIVFTRFYFENEEDFYEALVDVTAEKLLKQFILPADFHGQGEGEEVMLFEKIALEAPETKKELERLQLPAGTKTLVDPWPYGSDGDKDEKRMWQAYFYVASNGDTSHPDFNHYSLPLDFSLIIDDLTKKVVRVERLPIKFDGTLPTDQTKWEPAEGTQYHPDLIRQELRKDLKPLIISQPEGPSFTIDGERIRWQKWDFILGFNYREGPILRNVKYDGRPVFYRLALSEMNVPYGDPRRPYTRKSAFDLGDVGAGITCNDLKLGCDCLGSIAYFDGVVSNQAGDAIKKSNAICIHEQDAGIGWKHTNFRNDSACVVRKRELIMQSILTVANYEYGLYWILTTDGEISFEVKATGIVSTVPVARSEESCDFGIVVTPGCFAPIHQHLFVVRMDPAIDGYTGNKISLEETHPMPKDDKNPWGVGFKNVKIPVNTASTAEYNPSANRIVKIYNPNRIHPVSKQAASYKFTPMATQMLLAHPDSFNYKRAEFAKHPLYFTAYKEDQLYGGSTHTNQSRGGHGIESWVAGGDDLGDNPVVWHTFGLTHNPRIEDWPVMPVESFRMTVKPANFNVMNPAIDMPPSTQAINKSVLIEHNEVNGACCDSA